MSKVFYFEGKTRKQSCKKKRISFIHLRSSGKKVEKAKSSLGSPLSLVSGLLCKYLRYNQPIYVPNIKVGRYAAELSVKKLEAIDRTSVIEGNHCIEKPEARIESEHFSP